MLKSVKTENSSNLVGNSFSFSATIFVNEILDILPRLPFLVCFFCGK